MPIRKQGEASPSRLLEQVERMQAEVSSLEDGVLRTERLVALGMMAGLIAHEFNNILTPISAYVQVALKNPNKSELSQRALVKTLEGTTRAAKLAQIILEITKTPRRPPGPGGVDSAECCSVAGAAKAALESIEGNTSSAHVELRIEPGIIASIPPVALQTVLLNLVLNARAAMPPRGGALQISARRVNRLAVERLLGHKAGCSTWNVPDSYSLVQIDVEDTGRGMSAPQVLELRSQTTVMQPGASSNTGLGLAVCRSLVEASAGFLAIDSTCGKGTTCSIVLPTSA